MSKNHNSSTPLTTSDLHHAYLLVGPLDQAEKHLHAFAHDQGLSLLGSPDYFVWKEELFGIDEARKLTSFAALRPFTEKKIFFIAPEKLTLEAQNALLKTFEDPYPDTHFFLTVREEALVLPTLRSRMMLVRIGGDELKATSDAAKFLALPASERLSFARKFADAEKNLSAFLDELLLLSRSKQVYEMRLLSDARAASSRMILEHLSLVLP